MLKKVALSLIFIAFLFSPANAFCTAEDVEDRIKFISVDFGPNHPSNRQELFTEIARKLQMYHSFYVQKESGNFLYRVEITNGYNRVFQAGQGSTLCSCAVFSNKSDGFPIVGLGGKWGVNAGDTRTSDPVYYNVPSEVVKFIDNVTITAGYCHTDRIIKSMTKAAPQIAYTTMRAKLISKGVLAFVLPEKLPDS